MKYMLLIRIDESEPGPEVLMPAYDAFTSDLLRRGRLVHSNRLAGPPNVATVRIRDGKTLVTDGPYVETKEWLCGFYVVDCADREEALAVAAKIPSSPYGAIEVVPIAE